MIKGPKGKLEILIEGKDDWISICFSDAMKEDEMRRMVELSTSGTETIVKKFRYSYNGSVVEYDY